MKRFILAVFATAIIAAAMGAGTMAYFSASAASTGNSFSAGNMSFVIKDPTTGGTHGVFNVSGLKPGQVVVSTFSVANDSLTGMNEKWRAYVSGSGDLYSALWVRVTLNPTGTVAPANYTLAGPMNTALTTWVPMNSLFEPNTTPLVWQAPAEPFAPGWYSAYQLEVKMADDVGNAYQGKAFVGDINFYATQFENPGW